MRLMYLAAVMIVAGTCSAEQKKENALPEAALKVLENAEQLTLYSLDPSPVPREGTKLYEWVINGSTEVSTERKALLKELKDGIKASTGLVAACFNPRHAIRAVHDGRTIDVVICFECLSMIVYDATDAKEPKRLQSVLTTRTPEPAFDKILKAAKVPLAPKDGQAKGEAAK